MLPNFLNFYSLDKSSSPDSLYDSSIPRTFSFSSDSSSTSTKRTRIPSSSLLFWAFPGQAIAFIFESFTAKKDPESQSENTSRFFQWIRCESGSQDLCRESEAVNCGRRLQIHNNIDEDETETTLENSEVEEGSNFPGGCKATSVMILQNVAASDAGHYLCQEKFGSHQLSIEFRLCIANGNSIIFLVMYNL